MRKLRRFKASITIDDWKYSKNLNNKQLARVVYEDRVPPLRLPKHVTLPLNRAYEWKNGIRKRLATGKDLSCLFPHSSSS